MQAIRYVVSAARRWRPLTLAVGGLLAAVVAHADESVEAAGKTRFLENCAVCHGPDATGGGPFGGMLNKKPANLTVLSKNNKGAFPFNLVYDTIDGRGQGPAHGTKEMPIWGATWKKGGDIGAETAVRGRVLELIIYLRSIQQ